MSASILGGRPRCGMLLAAVVLGGLVGCAARSGSPAAANGTASSADEGGASDTQAGHAALPSQQAAPAQHMCPCKLGLLGDPLRQCKGSSDDSCLVFAEPVAALGRVLRERPRVLAIGETHALAAHGNVKTTTARFREELLPQLEDFHSLILETLIPAQGCQEAQAQVREQTAEVTAPQAKQNPNEFLQLAQAAKQAGITPYPLRLSCDELKSLAAAGERSVEQSLQLIASKTIERSKQLLSDQNARLLTYGGAMHNDLFPKPERQAWSFGPALQTLSSGGGGAGYVELDLITREFIADREPWTQLPWYPTYVQNCDSEGALLIQQGERSYALIFPWQSSDHAACPSSS